MLEYRSADPGLDWSGFTPPEIELKLPNEKRSLIDASNDSLTWDETESGLSDWHTSYSLLHKIFRRLIFRVSLTPIGSNFYYDNAFTYRVYWILKCIIIKKFYFQDVLSRTPRIHPHAIDYYAWTSNALCNTLVKSNICTLPKKLNWCRDST